MQEEAHDGHELGRFVPRDFDHVTQDAYELAAAFGSDPVCCTFGATAAAGGACGFDEPGSQEPIDCVVERATLECEKFVLVTVFE